MSKAASGLLPAAAKEIARFEVDVPSLFVKTVTLGADNELSGATFGVHPQDRDGDDIRVQHVWSVVKKGQRVKVTVRQGETGQRVIFHGWIVGATVRAGGRFEDITYVAVGLDWGLRVEKIFGSWCIDSEGNAQWLRAVPAVFNPDGKPNKSTLDATDDEDNLRAVFTLDADRENTSAEPWSAGDMVRYCVSCERKGSLSSTEGRIFETDDRPGSEVSTLTPLDVNVEGEDIWGALVKIANLCSHSVRIRYQDDRDKPDLVFFPRYSTEGTVTKQFELPAADGAEVSLDDPGRAVASIDAQTDLAGIVRRFDAVAPPKLYEHRFELLQGWKLEDEEAAFGSGDVGTQIARFLKETDPRTSSDWNRFRNVGRRYILNETGRDDTTTPEVGPWDFSAVFGSDPWAVRLRPFRHQRVTLSDKGIPLPVEVHVTPGSPLTEDFSLGHDVQLLSDRAGIYFRGMPPVVLPRALDSGDVADIWPDTVSIDAVVEGDQAFPYDVHGLLSGEDMPVPTFGLVRLDDGFRADNKNDYGDVEEKAQKLCDDAVSELKGERMVGSAVIPWISFQFDVGDFIDRIKGRDLKTRAMVAKVTYDAESQSTEIALQYPEIDTRTHSFQPLRSDLDPEPEPFGGEHDTRSSLLSDVLKARGDLGDTRTMGMLKAALDGDPTGHVRRMLGRATVEDVLRRMP